MTQRGVIIYLANRIKRVCALKGLGIAFKARLHATTVATTFAALLSGVFHFVCIDHRAAFFRQGWCQCVFSSCQEESNGVSV